METIKISVAVSVNLSENTQNFIKSLFSGATTPVAPTKPTPQPAAPAKTQNNVKPAPSAPAAQDASSVSKSIEEVRALLVAKVNDHREVIKQKLEELGAPSVSKLDPSKYDEMFNFLNEL
jgi:hypothetical protein